MFIYLFIYLHTSYTSPSVCLPACLPLCLYACVHVIMYATYSYPWLQVIKKSKLVTRTKLNLGFWTSFDAICPKRRFWQMMTARQVTVDGSHPSNIACFLRTTRLALELPRPYRKLQWLASYLISSGAFLLCFQAAALRSVMVISGSSQTVSPSSWIGAPCSASKAAESHDCPWNETKPLSNADGIQRNPSNQDTVASWILGWNQSTHSTGNLWGTAEKTASKKCQKKSSLLWERIDWATPSKVQQTLFLQLSKPSKPR